MMDGKRWEIKKKESEDLGDVLHEARVGVAEGDELVEVDEAVAVGVDLGHHALDLVGGCRPQRPQRVRQLRQRYLAVPVGVEPLEDPLHVSRWSSSHPDRSIDQTKQSNISLWSPPDRLISDFWWYSSLLAAIDPSSPVVDQQVWMIRSMIDRYRWAGGNECEEWRVLRRNNGGSGRWSRTTTRRRRWNRSTWNVDQLPGPCSAQPT